MRAGKACTRLVLDSRTALGCAAFVGNDDFDNR